MGHKAGLGLKFLQWFIRSVQFLCAALILGVYTYFLATLANHSLSISTTVRAVEGISGAAVLYTLIACLLLWCFAGRSVTAFLAMAIDLAFVGAFIYLAVANRDGSSSCSGTLNTPFGRGPAGQTTTEGSGGFTSLPSFRTACRLQTACFAVSIVGVFFFIFSLLMELALARHHRKEKRFGPSPNNNYTSGYGSAPVTEKKHKKFPLIGRIMPGRNKHTGDNVDNNALPEHTTPADLNRPVDNRGSYNTDTTAVGNDHLHHHKPADNGYAGNPYHQGDSYHHNGIAEMGSEEPARNYGSRPTTQAGHHGNAPPQQNYRYDDGIY